MNEDVLSQLKDIHLPPSLPWWYFSLSASVLAISVIALLGFFLCYFLRAKKRQLKREINKEFKAIESTFLENNNHSQLQAALAGLLRRIVFSQEKITVPKNGTLEDFATGLERMFKDKKKTSEIITILSTERFHEHPNIDGEHLLNLMREQIKRCRI